MIELAGKNAYERLRYMLHQEGMGNLIGILSRSPLNLDLLAVPSIPSLDSLMSSHATLHDSMETIEHALGLPENTCGETRRALLRWLRSLVTLLLKTQRQISILQSRSREGGLAALQRALSHELAGKIVPLSQVLGGLPHPLNSLPDGQDREAAMDLVAACTEFEDAVMLYSAAGGGPIHCVKCSFYRPTWEAGCRKLIG